jgi:hypothetical protein
MIDKGLVYRLALLAVAGVVTNLMAPVAPARAPAHVAVAPVATAPAVQPIAPAPKAPVAPPELAKRMTLLPPVEYDHPYTKGFLTITVYDSQEGIAGVCPLPNPGNSWPFGVPFPRVACARVFDNGCMISIANDATIRAAGLDPDVIKRHEIAHCGGWPADHPGARPSEVAAQQTQMRGSR